MTITPGRLRDRLIGWAIYGLVAAGVLGITASVLTFLGGDRVASAVFLLAAGVAFGMLASVLLRE